MQWVGNCLPLAFLPFSILAAANILELDYDDIATCWRLRIWFLEVLSVHMIRSSEHITFAHCARRVENCGLINCSHRLIMYETWNC